MRACVSVCCCTLRACACWPPAVLARIRSARQTLSLLLCDPARGDGPCCPLTRPSTTTHTHTYITYTTTTAHSWRKELTWRCFLVSAVTIVVVRYLVASCVARGRCAYLQWGSLAWFQQAYPSPYTQARWGERGGRRHCRGELDRRLENRVMESALRSSTPLALLQPSSNSKRVKRQGPQIKRRPRINPKQTGLGLCLARRARRLRRRALHRVQHVGVPRAQALVGLAEPARARGERARKGVTAREGEPPLTHSVGS